MSRRVQVSPLGVVLSREDLMGDRHGRDSRLFYVASKNRENINIEISAIEVCGDAQEAQLAPRSKLG
jgi:hypothetical protein